METIKIGETELKTSEVTQVLKDSGFVVRTKEEDDTSRDKYLQGLSSSDEKVKHIIGPIVRSEREGFENLTKELTGLDKVSVDEPAKEYAKRAFGEIKKSLEAKAKEGITDSELKAKIDQVEKDFADREKVWKKKEQERESEFKKLGFQSKIDSYISSKKLKDDLDQDLLKSHLNSIKNEALTSSFEERKLGEETLGVFIDSHSSVRYDDNGDPLTLERFIDGKLSKYYHEDRKLNGNGTKLTDSSGGDKTFSMSGDIKYKEDLIKALIDSGLKQGSEEYQKLYKEHSKNLSLKGV